MTPQAKEKLWDVIYRMASAAVVACVAAVIVHEVRLSVIESNRFTSGDALSLQKEIVSSLPPQWTRELLSELKESDLRQQELLRGILERLTKIETTLENGK